MIFGIDIGLGGAIALLENDGTLVHLWDMPCLQDGPSKRRTINPILLGDILDYGGVTRAFVELVGPRPGEGVVGAFAFGRSRGVIEGVLGALQIPFSTISPARWKAFHTIPPGKDGVKDIARSRAMHLWPTKARHFARVKDDGRAEAALIGVAGLHLIGDPPHGRRPSPSSRPKPRARKEAVRAPAAPEADAELREGHAGTASGRPPQLL